MASLNWRMLKAAMEHYLSAGSQTADEVLRPEEKLGEISHRRQLLGIGPTQLLDMPLGAKLPLLPGSSTLFYRTNLGEKLYQPPSGFDLGDPYCRLMTTKYRSLHDPHLRSYYKRKNNLRRLKKGGYVTNDNKVVCTLKEFNEYRQYLTTLKLEFEKNYMREQKMLEKQVTKLQDPILLPEGADTSHFREWLLREERENLQERERQMRNRNSFQNLKKPDVTRVELLKDVKSKEELISRLVSYDIQHDEDEDFEQIVKVDSTSVFESQEYAAVEQEIMPAYESAPLADMWNNLIAAQAPEKADQYKRFMVTAIRPPVTDAGAPTLDKQKMQFKSSRGFRVYLERQPVQIRVQTAFQSKSRECLIVDTPGGPIRHAHRIWASH
ncbi:fibrous sheath-interacting protein 2-like [Chelonoidis abingdonii]|uniref:fibrous sheath-interacting protein 2-like n=1 Tax=Chelonoidis abingdonii TaxID=106734 RepID=UPI003F496062